MSTTQIKQRRLHLTLFMGFLCFGLMGQFYNKEVDAKIEVEQNSEFYTFKATAENSTPSDLNLRYDFMVFKRDNGGNTAKSSQVDRFFLNANQKTILSTMTINYGVKNNIILVLVIYDEKDKPIGQDRLELPLGGQTPVDKLKAPPATVNSEDQAKLNDGFVLGGLVVENTITKAGRDFYRYFYSDYFNRGIKSTVNIHIDEVPGRGRTTLLSVKVDDKLVWQFFSQPRKDFLMKMASTAIQRTIMQLQRMQQQQEQLTRY